MKAIFLVYCIFSAICGIAFQFYFTAFNFPEPPESPPLPVPTVFFQRFGEFFISGYIISLISLQILFRGGFEKHVAGIFLTQLLLNFVCLVYFVASIMPFAGIFFPMK